MANFHGSFIWYEMMTTDGPAALAFYRKVVGWGARDAGMEGMTYTMLLAGETPVGGLMEMPRAMIDAGARPAWMAHIAVDDVDDYAARVTKGGGTIHREPTDIPGVGRFALAADPQGAMFFLFRASGEMAPAPTAMGRPGFFGWRELMAGDMKAVFPFYADLFGWTKAESHDMGAMGPYQLFAVRGETIGGMMTKPPNLPAPFWSYYAEVEAMTPAVERLKAEGGTVLNGPHQVPGGTWAVQCQDPQGAMFCLVSVGA